MSIPAAAAIAFAVTTALVVAFQAALALGAPWGAYAMGGAIRGRMPPTLRVAAVVQGLLLFGVALIVLADAALVSVGLVNEWPWLAWIPVAVSAIAVVLNGSTRSRGERRIWLPVSLVLLVSSLVVALG
jgi:cytochrome bd-type quinol oxidase subunit 2